MDERIEQCDVQAGTKIVLADKHISSEHSRNSSFQSAEEKQNRRLFSGLPAYCLRAARHIGTRQKPILHNNDKRKVFPPVLFSFSCDSLYFWPVARGIVTFCQEWSCSFSSPSCLGWASIAHIPTLYVSFLVFIPTLYVSFLVFFSDLVRLFSCFFFRPCTSLFMFFFRPCTSLSWFWFFLFSLFLPTMIMLFLIHFVPWLGINCIHSDLVCLFSFFVRLFSCFFFDLVRLFSCSRNAFLNSLHHF